MAKWSISYGSNLDLMEVVVLGYYWEFFFFFLGLNLLVMCFRDIWIGVGFGFM